jgi:glycosyltransferase involved in cell wall biosynthesis
VHRKKLRIAIISREYPPDTGFGGMATFANHLAHGLTEIGHSVDVITLAKDQPKELVVDGINVHRVRFYLKDNDLGLLGRAVPYTRFVISASSALWQKFLELHNQEPFDVVDAPEHLAEGFYPAISKVAPLAIRLYTPHSKFIAEGLHNVSASFDHQCVAMFERAAMLHADRLTSPSRDLAEFVSQDMNYPLDAIKLIYNPIDPTEFCPEGKMAIEADDDRLKVVFVGRLEERKGVRYLVHAIPEVVRAVPNAHFYIIGDDTNTAKGQTSALAELKQFIAETNCGANITFIPRVLLTELPMYYRSADISIVPSLYDNSPYTCLEAMSCGRPVIGTNAGGTPEYIGDAGVLIEPKDSKAIAQALIALLKDEKKRKALGQMARERVLKLFQRTAVAEQTAELYQEAIENYQLKQQGPLYGKDCEYLLSDADQLASSFNMMLHNELFRWSWRYRIATFVNGVKTRPRFFLADTVLKLAKKLVPAWSESTEHAPAPVAWLENQVREKQLEAINAKSLTSAAGK